MAIGKIKKVAGPLVIAEGMRDANMFDVVRVSDSRLIGEIIEMHGDEASVQVYEETSGLGPGEPVESTGMPLSVELGPGLISSIYDGIQRPLDDIMKICGNNLARGVEVPSLKRDIKWTFVPVAKVGDKVTAGDVIGTVQETVVVTQKIMVPYGVEGTVKEIKTGDFTVDEVVCIVATDKGDRELTLMQKWPVRRGRPYVEKDLDQWFGHALGHSVGLEIHETPTLSPRDHTVICTGMTETVEPGVYIPGVGGVRIEDTVVIEKDGISILTKFPKKFLRV